MTLEVQAFLKILSERRSIFLFVLLVCPFLLRALHKFCCQNVGQDECIFVYLCLQNGTRKEELHIRDCFFECLFSKMITMILCGAKWNDNGIYFMFFVVTNAGLSESLKNVLYEL